MMIISGGQTGVDRAALDVAIQLKIPHGGFAPKGRKAEDGIIDQRYHLTELPTTSYEDRTKANVDWADATLILYKGVLEGGTLLTWNYAKARQKPILHIDLDAHSFDTIVLQCQKWLETTQPKRLNIAGPRESKFPGIYTDSLQILLKSLKKPFPFL
ncbi:MAG: molybdenum cofactor carrier [Deltaproteobacteria bacterium CG11_big_fil_rev_8_21_14_0_20_47_16]|nr:MAG: molybdenum cofactor carrier [Deltaproteobacteria bacterium CG11_big_fil_rev_8_21_14_0_20_47_16]